MSVDILSSWRKGRCVLATMHGKEAVIAPLMQRELGVTVEVPEHFDTDRFGTFTREVKRTGTQLEAARKKALAALELTGAELAIASEGSFGAHPALPFVSSSLELVLLVDKSNDLEIVGHSRSSTVQARGQTVSSTDEVLELAKSWGFPEQGVILRLSEKSNRHIHKDLITSDELAATSEELLSKWFVNSIFLETDMRAHRCPARMKSIEEATIDLIKNCKSVCPKCATPGFVVTGVVRGLLCRQCGRPTDLVRDVRRVCQKCKHEEVCKAEGRDSAEPGECSWCNP